MKTKSLHASLKEWYSEPGDLIEAWVDGYRIDIVRGDLLIEIQTTGFGALRDKLQDLLQRHPVRLIHPIPVEKWLVKKPASGIGRPTRRKSPKKGSLLDLFSELVSFPGFLAEDNLGLEVLLTREEEVRHHDPNKAWRRRGWVVEQRRLIDVVETHLFDSPDQLSTLLPPDLPQQFTTADLADALGRPRRLAQQMAYCLREMDLLAQVGRRQRSVLYERSEQSSSPPG
jgi:hypothetical protein